MGLSPPNDPILASVARAVEGAGLTGFIADKGWRVVWFSEEYGTFFGMADELVRLMGTSAVRFTLSQPHRRLVTERSLMRSGIDLLSAILADVPGGKATLSAWVDAELGDGASAILDGLEPNPMPVWFSGLNVLPAHGMAPARTSMLGIRLFDPEGNLVGHLLLFGTAVPSRYVPMLARGDPATLERLASLISPARRDVVVLSADLQDSAVLARRLSMAGFFELITRTTSTSDRRIVEQGGVVGRHAGDGIMAFFLADHLGGGSGAARAAIEVATSLRAIVDRAASNTVSDVTVNVALHYGNVYMGQLVSEGRLEVTALGDTVNECARIGECARDGAVLASKAVIEQLNEEDAHAIGVYPSKIRYERLEDLPSASPKARRDAGGIAVTRLA